MFWIIIIVAVLAVLAAINDYAGKYKDLAKQFETLYSKYIELQKRYASLEKLGRKVPDAEYSATLILQNASNEAQRIISEAREYAGNALDARDNAKLYEKTAKAMKNIIDGYGNDYLMPSHSLLEDLADTYGFTQASKDFKAVRAKIRSMLKDNKAAACDYSEASRRQTAISFIIDAFNGKVESILSRAKSDNFGTLRQKLTDAGKSRKLFVRPHKKNAANKPSLWISRQKQDMFT